MKILRLTIPVLCMLASSLSTAGVLDRRDAPVLIAEIRTAGSTLRFEQVDNKVILLSEISDPINGDAAEPVVASLMSQAKSQSVDLCPAQIYGLVSDLPIPDVLWRACADPMAAEQLGNLRAQAKSITVDSSPVTTIGSYCVGATGYQSFRTRECERMLTRLEGQFLFEDDSSYWCANTLKKTTDRSMSGAIDEEGEGAELSAVSCTGNTRVRFYLRGSTSNSWQLVRDHQLGPSQRIGLYGWDDDDFGDSDFRFRLDSGNGAWHRSTGYFIDY